MRVGINALFQGHGGSIKNLTSLLEHWGKSDARQRHNFVLFTSQGTLDQLAPVRFPELEVVVFPGSDRGIFARLIIEQTKLVSAIKQQQLDVLFCPANTMPFPTRIPCVTTFQNAMPFCPSITPRTEGLYPWFRFALLGVFMRMSAKRAARVIFISHFFRDLFVNRFGVAPEKCNVIYRAREDAPRVDTRLGIEVVPGLTRPYVLSVSHLHPYKNLPQLIEGFLLAVKHTGRSDLQLVIPGKDLFNNYRARLLDMLHKQGVPPDQVLLPGKLSQEQIRSLLAGCFLFAFSSTCENCPNGLIEAISMGLPIACSNIGVMPEITGDAALLFDPYNPQEVGSVLTRLITDENLRRDLSAKAAERALRFPTPAEVARQTLAVLEQAAGTPAAGGR